MVAVVPGTAKGDKMLQGVACPYVGFSPRPILVQYVRI